MAKDSNRDSGENEEGIFMLKILSETENVLSRCFSLLLFIIYLCVSVYDFEFARIIITMSGIW